MFIFAFLILVIVGLFYYYLTKNYNFWKKRHIEGPEPALFVGTYPSLYNKKRHLVDEVNALYQKYKGKTAFVGTYYGVNPHLMLFDTGLIKKVLIQNFSNFNVQALMPEFDETHDPLAGQNPFFLKGEVWKEKRNEITPAFSTGRIKALFPIMMEVSERMRKYLLQQKVNGGIETRELCAKYTTDVVAASIFGMEGGSFTNQDSKVRKLARDVMSPNWRLMFIMMLHPTFPILAKIFKCRFVPEDEANFLIDLLRQTLQYRKENNIDRQDYVDYLTHLRDKKGLPEIAVAAHTVTFFFDGIETSSITLSFILYELAKNQRVQEKLRQILLDASKNTTFTYEIVNENKYMDQVVFESMRLNAVVPMLAKLCTEDIELTTSDGQNVIFEKGMGVSLPIRNIHLDPEYYEKPEEFVPERFDEENGGVKAFREKGVFLPFGDGPRICLGQRFALAQMKCAIANLITQFKVTVSHKMPSKPEFNPMEMMLVYKSGILLDYQPI